MFVEISNPAAQQAATPQNNNSAPNYGGAATSQSLDTGSFQKSVEEVVLKMKRHDRMGGSVPVWEKQSRPQDQIAQNITNAAFGGQQDMEVAMAYADGSHGSMGTKAKPFTFGDLIDMANPLQHIPLVGHLYREVTGDEIRPMAKIMGGGFYGGPAAVAAGLFDTVSEYETGEDMLGHALNMMDVGETEETSYDDNAPHNDTEQNPVLQLNKAYDTPSSHDGMGYSTPHQATLSSGTQYADLGYGKRQVYENAALAYGRTAGTIQNSYTEVTPSVVTQREPVTEIKLSAMPKRTSFSFND